MAFTVEEQRAALLKSADTQRAQERAGDSRIPLNEAETQQFQSITGAQFTQMQAGNERLQAITDPAKLFAGPNINPAFIRQQLLGQSAGPTSRTPEEAREFMETRIVRQRETRELNTSLSDFRMQELKRAIQGNFVGDEVTTELTDPLEGVERGTLLDAIGTGPFSRLGTRGGVPQRPGGTEGGSSFATGGGSLFGGSGGGGGGARSGGSLFGGSGGGGAINPAVRTSLRDFFSGREMLIDQAVGDLESSGVRAVDFLQQKVPELAAAAEVAEGAFGADIGDDFSQALREAAAVRGLDPSSLGDIGSGFNAGLAANAFLGSAESLATQTGFEQLLQAGFAPPQNVNFGTIGSLAIQEAELSAQMAASIAQSQTAQALFSQQLSGIFGGR